MKINKQIEQRVAGLRQELAGVQRASLVAARNGDYMRVGRLTAMAAGLSKSLMEADGLVSLDLF